MEPAKDPIEEDDKIEAVPALNEEEKKDIPLDPA